MASCSTPTESVSAGRLQGRPAIVVSSEGPEWGSCKIITPNLEKAYRLAFGQDANYFSFRAYMHPGQIWILAEEIYASRPDRLVFLDHMPHPQALIKALERLYGRKPLPPMYVHVYGDFTLYSREWLSLQDLMVRTRVEFICASHRQVNLVSRFLTDARGAVKYCPFPVDRNSYHSDEELRRKWRAELGIKDTDLAILYTGRLSLQKNSVRMLNEAVHFAETRGRSVEFLLAGSFDDLGAPFFGVNLKKGYYFQRWRAGFEAIDPEIQRSIRYLGQFGSDVLKGLYNAADMYFSLSLHHDEDYGMSPAESLCSGTPCALTSWGGYASFVLEDPAKNAVSLIDVDLRVEGLEIHSPVVQAALKEQATADQSPEARKARSEAYLDLVSIEAAEKRIRGFHEELPPQFEGFNWLMQRHAESLAGPILFPLGPKKGTFYEEIYGAYIQG